MTRGSETRAEKPGRGPHGTGAGPARRWAVDAAIAVAVTAAQIGGTYAG